jgi:hypothetical protein
LELSKTQVSQQDPSRICFIRSGWHVIIRELYLLSLKMQEEDNSKVSTNKCTCKTIMALKPNQLQVKTYHPQANAIIERVHKVAYSQWHAQIIWLGKQSWKSNHHEDNPFDYFLQSTSWLSCHYKHLLHNIVGNRKQEQQLNSLWI